MPLARKSDPNDWPVSAGRGSPRGGVLSAAMALGRSGDEGPSAGSRWEVGDEL